MPIFTAVAAAVSAAVGGGIFGAVAGFAARTLLTVGITKLIGNRSNSNASGTQDAGSRVQLPPATNNKVPVVYGTAYMAPIITDAKISEDQKTMWYVCTLAETTDTGSYTFGDIYWGGKKVVFDGTDTAKVIQLETNSDPVQIDDKVNGKIYIYKFPNGSASGISTGGANAITLLSDASIPADLQWDGPLYTSDGQSASMTNLAFLVVKVTYDTNAGTTNLATMNVELTNSLTKPGEVLYDYMTNDRYGCAILPGDIDTASLTVLDTYSDELITYVPTTGGTATQARYRINGPVNTGQNCLSNLQQLVDACDSWLQYSELTGEWTIVVNKPYDWDGTVIGDLFLIDSSILISGINVNPIDLNSSYNVLEVQYPNTNINDQTDYNIINLIDYVPEVMSYNEPPNQLTVQFPQVNDYIQSTYLGIRRLLQSREDITIDCTLDYSGIQIQAGDVVRVMFEPYGWDGLEFPDGKLFRVSQVQEAKLDDGSLGARITAFEYNGTVYYDDPINDFIPASNTGLTDPNIISQPGKPTAVTNPLNDGNIKSFKVSSTVPLSGTVLYMDFNYGLTSDVGSHLRYRTVSKGDGLPYTAGETVTIDVNDALPATYYISTTGRNDFAGRQSISSDPFVWAGPGVTTYNTNNFVCAYSSGNIITVAELTSNVYPGMNVTITGGTGTLGANTLVTQVLTSNTFSVDPSPVVALSCANLLVSGGGIADDNIQPSGVIAGTYINATITVNSKGIITNAGNGTANIALGGTNWSIFNSNGTSVTLPINAATNPTRNVPIYFYGTGVDANNTYPWAQGTSNSLPGNNGNNYYGANSTGSFTPYGAGQLLIADGEDNWYTVVTDDSMAGEILPGDTYSQNYGFTVVSDTTGTLVQIVEGIRYAGVGYYQCGTDQMETLVLDVGMPQSFTKTKFYTTGTAIVESASFVRCITEGANVTFTQATLSSGKYISVI